MVINIVPYFTIAECIKNVGCRGRERVQRVCLYDGIAGRPIFLLYSQSLNSPANENPFTYRYNQGVNAFIVQGAVDHRLKRFYMIDGIIGD